MSTTNNVPWEHQSVENFVQFLIDDEERTFCTYSEIEDLAEDLKIHPCTVRRRVVEYGVTVQDRQKAQNVRGFKSRDNNRWESTPSHGGSGWSQIIGLAGKAG